MSCYVDASIYSFGRMIMCHLIADTLEELHAMADTIGVERRWFQAEASFPHYDIAKTKRVLAVAAGAIDCDRRTFVGHMRRIRGDAPLVPPLTEEQEERAAIMQYDGGLSREEVEAHAQSSKWYRENILNVMQHVEATDEKVGSSVDAGGVDDTSFEFGGNAPNGGGLVDDRMR